MTCLNKQNTVDYHEKTGLPKTTAEQFVDNLLSTESLNAPSDNANPDTFVMELPKWFDEEKFNRGRQFFKEFCFSFATSMLMGLLTVLSVPSILKVLIGTRRSNSSYTAYKRYSSTLLHVYTWFEYELKPGSVSWRSLYTVRSRHFQAGLASKAKGTGVVSQRDLALTQFGFFGFTMLKPDEYSLYQLKEGDWDAYNHVWRVIGYMIGLEDRYNLCRESLEETLEVCQLLVERVFRPCLENPPEYFEHAARVMLDGMQCVQPIIDTDAALWWTKHTAGVPGYVYSEAERRNLLATIKGKLDAEGKPLTAGVDISTLMDKPGVEGLPELPPRLIYYNDFYSISSIPSYKELPAVAKFKMYFASFICFLYGSSFGRWYFNVCFRIIVFLVTYLPLAAFFKYGIKESYVNIFKEDPKDDTPLKLNAEFKLKKE